MRTTVEGPAEPAGASTAGGTLSPAELDDLLAFAFMSHPYMDVTGRARERVYPYRIGF